MIRLHRDRELWMTLSRIGLKNIHFCRTAARRSLEELLTQLEVLGDTPRPGTTRGNLLTGGALNR